MESKRKKKNAKRKRRSEAEFRDIENVATSRERETEERLPSLAFAFSVNEDFDVFSARFLKPHQNNAVEETEGQIQKERFAAEKGYLQCSKYDLPLLYEYSPYHRLSSSTHNSVVTGCLPPGLASSAQHPPGPSRPVLTTTVGQTISQKQSSRAELVEKLRQKLLSAAQKKRRDGPGVVSEEASLKNRREERKRRKKKQLVGSTTAQNVDCPPSSHRSEEEGRRRDGKQRADCLSTAETRQTLETASSTASSTNALLTFPFIADSHTGKLNRTEAELMDFNTLQLHETGLDLIRHKREVRSRGIAKRKVQRKLVIASQKKEDFSGECSSNGGLSKQQRRMLLLHRRTPIQRALAKAEGLKKVPLTDLSKLRKLQKTADRQKARSESTWRLRLEGQEKEKRDRQLKRKENIRKYRTASGKALVRREMQKQSASGRGKQTTKKDLSTRKPKSKKSESRKNRSQRDNALSTSS